MFRTQRRYVCLTMPLLFMITCVAAQSINYGAFLESFDVFQARYDGSAVSINLLFPNSLLPGSAPLVYEPR
jgi:hypothetical protein